MEGRDRVNFAFDVRKFSELGLTKNTERRVSFF